LEQAVTEIDRQAADQHGNQALEKAQKERIHRSHRRS
jgi:hypothetical protein